MNIKERYIKSPLNYVGGKYKLLPQILPLFPNDIRVFVDLFGGGFNVGVNTDSKYTIYNDSEKHVVELMKYLSETDVDKSLVEINNFIERFNLSKENAEGFNQLRDYYNNENNNPIVFYTLICYAFNNQIRFNSKGKYNMPFGKNRSSFNPILRRKFIDFVNELHKKDCQFFNCKFNKFNFNNLSNDDFIYCDPPYFNSIAAYNENGGWTMKDEVDLHNFCDYLTSIGIKWGLSNVYENKGVLNNQLKEWQEKNNYNVYYFDDFTYCSCGKGNSNTKEVFITNY